jgi:hypothetical protein
MAYLTCKSKEIVGLMYEYKPTISRISVPEHGLGSTCEAAVGVEKKVCGLHFNCTRSVVWMDLTARGFW